MSRLPLFPVDTGLTPVQPSVETAVRTFWRYYFAGQALAAMDLRGDYSAGPCNAAVVKRCVLIADHVLDALESDHTFGSPEVSDAG